jgi:hypothetical protein
MAEYPEANFSLPICQAANSLGLLAKCYYLATTQLAMQLIRFRRKQIEIMDIVDSPPGRFVNVAGFPIKATVCQILLILHARLSLGATWSLPNRQTDPMSRPFSDLLKTEVFRMLRLLPESIFAASEFRPMKNE